MAAEKAPAFIAFHSSSTKGTNCAGLSRQSARSRWKLPAGSSFTSSAKKVNRQRVRKAATGSAG